MQDPSLVRLFRGNGYQVNLVNHWNYLRFPGKELTSGQHEASISTYLLQNSIFYQVRPIREKIELNPKEPDYIKVVWGIGYKMEQHGT